MEAQDITLQMLDFTHSQTTVTTLEVFNVYVIIYTCIEKNLYSLHTFNLT
jgi:hypothetical protein